MPKLGNSRFLFRINFVKAKTSPGSSDNSTSMSKIDFNYTNKY